MFKASQEKENPCFSTECADCNAVKNQREKFLKYA